MRRELIRSEAFVRAARRLIKKHPEIEDRLRTTLAQLAADAQHPSLRTHKLRGDMDDFHACSAGYDLRIVFSFVVHEGRQAILLQTMGTHDEVY